MKKQIIDTAKKLNIKLDLDNLLKLQINNEYLNAKSYCSEVEEFTKDDILILFITLVGFNLKKNPELSTKILLNCLNNANIFICKLIFKKKLIINNETKEVLKNYINVNGFRTIISKILIKNNVFWEDEHIYDIKKLQHFIENLKNKDLNNNIIDILFKICHTINTSEFKYTRKTLKQLPIDKLLDFLPKLNKKGYINFKTLSENNNNYNVMMKQIHDSEVQVEFIKRLDSFFELYNYILNFKPINSIHTINNLMSYIKCQINELKINHEIICKTSILKSEKFLFNEFKNQIMYDFVIPKCKSSDFHDRYFGINLFLELYDNNYIFVNKEIIIKLIFDKSNEIRDLTKKLIPYVISNHYDYINKLQTDDVAIIEGVINILEYKDKSLVYKYFETNILSKVGIYDKNKYMKDKFSSDIEKINLSVNLNKFDKKIKMIVKMPIYGFIKYFGHVKYIDEELKILILYIYKYTIKKTKKHYWKTFKECCYYLNEIGYSTKVMNALLKTDHFGIISNIKIFINSDNLNLEKLLRKGSKTISNKKNCVRKSGGLSIYYSILIRNKNNYLKIRNSLLNLMLINNNYDNIDNINFNKNETVVIHCLNIFYKILEFNLFDDIELYLILTFKALLCNSFNIKNCGCAIFCMLLRKIINRYKNKNIFFKIHINCRKLIYSYFEKSLENTNKDVIYFILFLYSDIDFLNKEEIKKIEEARKYGEFISLKANYILNSIKMK